MEYSYNFTEDEYDFYVKEVLAKNNKYTNNKLINKVEKTKKGALVIILICIYLMVFISMIVGDFNLISSAIFASIITILTYFFITKARSKFLKYASNNVYKFIYELNLKEKGKKKVVLDGPFLKYYSGNEITEVNCKLINNIYKNENFLIISFIDSNIYIPLRVIGSYNEEEDFVNKINWYKDNNNESIKDNFDGISTKEILIDDSDINEIIKYSLHNKEVISKFLKILLPIFIIEIVEFILIYLLLHILKLKAISIILILIILFVITNFILLPKFIKKILKKILNKDDKVRNGYRIYINNSGIYSLKKQLLIGSVWNKNLILDKHNDNYFLIAGVTMIAYIPVKAFDNMEERELFINRLKDYLKK